MKVIDLLNRIANGEEVPKKVKYKNKIYEWKEYDCGYEKKRKIDWVKEHGYVAEENRTYFYLKHCYQDLNDEVEIIEEDKKIETIDLSEWSEITYQEDWDLLTKDFNRNSNLFVDKINEIIDYINGSDKEWVKKKRKK